MSFAWPFALIALLAIPVLIRWYLAQQRRRARAVAAFVAAPLAPSVTPRNPRWRRHLPMLAFGVALIVLIVAAARPRQTVAVPLNEATVLLANDVSSSMAATDVAPSRLGAAVRAADEFLLSVPRAARVGLLQFNQKASVLQSPTANHSLIRSALSELRAGGHTAIGDGIQTALRMLASVPAQAGKRPVGAIVLLSDGTSTTGSDPLAAARTAASKHVPIYTATLGTANGTIKVGRAPHTVTVRVPASPQQLAQIAQLSGGEAFTAATAARLNTVYAQLGSKIGHKHVKHEVTASLAGGGLVLLLLGSAMSLRWFGRLV
jgi:Ca-activated chloride channel family protein